MRSLKARCGSCITPRTFMPLLLLMSETPTLSHGTMCFSKLFLAQKIKNSVSESFIFHWFSIIHFLTLFTLHSRFSSIVILPYFKDLSSYHLHILTGYWA